MLEHLVSEYVPIIVHILEIMGIVVITIGSFKAFYYYILEVIFRKRAMAKHQFATSMAVGLEFKLAAEILKTVLVKTLDELFILGAVFLLRVLMTFVIQWEIKQDSTGDIENRNKEG